MWLSIVIFMLQHATELFGIAQTILAFFKAHRDNPQMSNWIREFSAVMQKAMDTKDPQPVRDFLQKLEESLKVAG